MSKPEFRRMYVREYLSWCDQPQHRWEVFGAHAGAHLHIREYKQGEFSSGLEFHSRTPLRANTAPDYKDCPVIGGLCWHDGTSAYATEHFLPMFLRQASDDEMFSEIENWLRRRTR